MHRHLSTFALSALFLMGCPKQAPLPDLAADAGVVAIPPAPTASAGPGLRLKVEPLDAELIIDGESYGVVSELQTTNGVLQLRTGIYQVLVRRAGYTSWRAEVTVSDQPETLQVTLIKKP